MKNDTIGSPLVLIAEGLERKAGEIYQYDTTLEMAEKDYTDDLCSVLKELNEDLTVYTSPADLQKNIERHIDSIVMTIWGGKISRNRMALVPAICEASSIMYMGADTYARIICQDKHLTKQLARRIGISTPKYLLVERACDLSALELLRLPLVVKPCMEGSSIGISKNSLVTSYDDAHKQAITCLDKLNSPLLIEEFVPGQEVSVCVVGTPEKIFHFEAVEDIHVDNASFFKDNLYSYDLKSAYYHKFSHQLATDQISDSLRDKLLELFKRLGKIDYLRIDGRMSDGHFELIELTPDPYLAKKSGFTRSFTLSGLSYKDGIKLLIKAAQINSPIPYASEP